MAWQKQGVPALRMAVNLSPRQFTSETLLSDIEAALARSEMPPDLLELEITESTVMQNVERASRLLRAINMIGGRAPHLSSSRAMVCDVLRDDLRIEAEQLRLRWIDRHLHPMNVRRSVGFDTDEVFEAPVRPRAE